MPPGWTRSNVSTFPVVAEYSAAQPARQTLSGFVFTAPCSGFRVETAPTHSVHREVTDAATTYLVISVWGLPAMLIVLATTGLLRGLQDTRTPLVVVGIGFGANALLNAAFIYGFGWGIAGSALGTVLAQWGMAVIFLWRIVVLAHRERARVSPRWVGVATVAASGGWLLLRTVSLRVALLATVVVGSALSVAELGALQIGLALFSLLAFGLDALAIAGQAMIGAAFGAVDRARVVAITRRLILFGVAGGVGLGVVVAALSPVLGLVFTSDTDVTDAVVPVVLLLALGTPLAGFVFVLDGVLIGANDSRYLAVSGILNLAMYLPLLWLAAQSQSLVALWAAFGLGYIGARALTLGLRVRGERWVERSIDRSTAARSTRTIRFVGAGFVFQGIMIASGSIWANEAWGRYWGWDAVETWSLIAWAIYAVYLHLTLTLGWRGRKAAWVAILALPVSLFSLLGVPIAYNSIHGAYLKL